MNEWIKNMFINTFTYGLDKFGLISNKIITILLNQYGKRLLKMDTDKIVKESVCHNDYNILYLYPLHIKEVNQEFSLNSIQILEGTINNSTIILPWKKLFTESTIINISDIYLRVSISHNTENINPDRSAITNLYLSYDMEEEKSLLNIYNEIHEYLIQFLYRIKFNIDLVKITIIDHFDATLKNISVDNCELSIKSVELWSPSNSKLLNIDMVKYQFSSKCLNLGTIVIDSDIVTKLPEIRLSSSGKYLDIDIVIDKFKMEELSIENIYLTINENILTVKRLDYVNITNMIFLSYSHNLDQKIVSFDGNTLTITFQSHLEFELFNTMELIQWTKKIYNILLLIFKKVVFCHSNNQNRLGNIVINNLDIKIIYKNNGIYIQIEKFSFGEKINISSVTVRYNEITSRCTTIISNNTRDFFPHNLSVNTDNIVVAFDLVQITKKDFNLCIDITGGNVKNIIPVINLISNTIKKHVTEHHKEINIKCISKVDIRIFESRICYCHKEDNIVFLLKKANICFYEKDDNRKILASAKISLLFDDHIIAIISINYSPEIIIINKFRIFIDPNIFDKISYLCGILRPERYQSKDIFYRNAPPELLEKLQIALSRSVIVENISQLECHINEEANIVIYNYAGFRNDPNINILTTSINDLREIIIDNYIPDNKKKSNIDIKLHIESIQICFYDKLNKITENEKKSFMHVILKNIYFKKMSEKIQEKNNNDIIKIIEYGKYQNVEYKHRYLIRIKNGAIIDTTCQKLEWKYFAKFVENMLNIDMIIKNDCLSINMIIGQFVANIREETLIRLFSFLSCNHHFPKKASCFYVESLEIGPINGIINYYPIILNNIGICQESLAIKNFRLNLKSQSIKYVGNLDCAIKKVIDNWRKEIDPKNILQFIPNINIIQPYVTPMIRLVHLISQYLKHPSNRKKVRTITKNVNNSADIVLRLLKSGICHVWDIFN